MMEMIKAIKPEGSTWTDEQWSAIVTEGSNILVAAAAGSGKTAVLVERIIRKISSSTDVDRLLVATFTKAAAAEMKERIRLALEKELDRQPESEHLRRQLALMNRSSITTLHSFCLDVIRRYYPLIGLDPGFRIANETESELLRMEVLDQLFEEKYDEADADSGAGGAFLALADRLGGERGDEPLYKLVQDLYAFAQSHPWPKEWLRETAQSFNVQNAAELQHSKWVASLRADVELALAGAEALLRKGLDLTREPAGPAPYAANFENDLALVLMLKTAVQESPWEQWFEPFHTVGFGKLKAMRGDEYDKSLQEQAKDLRDGAKKLLATLADELFGRTPEQFLEELQELAPLMAALSELIIDFGKRYEAAKREKGLLDFGDLEHYCLRILRTEDSSVEQTLPSNAALEYQNQFDEILLDEYQDMNMVQEAIVTLISRPGAGNRFMVGDVKQSIYRFRLAEPNLFMHKYKSYAVQIALHDMDEADKEAATHASSIAQAASSDEQSAGLRIDLARNFRSRQEVVDGVNDVFRGIMRESVAEMDYDQRAELVCGASYPAAEETGAYEVELIVIDKAGSVIADDKVQPEDEDEEQDAAESAEDLQTAQLEGRLIARKIQSLMDSGYRVYDGKNKRSRPLEWRDIVILLRATSQWAPIIIEELQADGVPAYAELSSGYFDAIEVQTILSLLRVIDNPYQDIPLAGTLRSPIFGLDAEELALIRIEKSGVSYFEALLAAEGSLTLPEALRQKLTHFLAQLERWRSEARQGALADLIWRIYRETAYYDFAGGLPGGTQRQANLRALHDRARGYEATSFRGLFRFLRFVERMRDSGGDLGTARALGEQENVVRIMSIHKSKGLEFPVVFTAGLGKSFNQQDLRSAFLRHKQLGFGPRFVDPQQRVSYPTLPFLAIRRRLRMEMLAEEMRILYVALTRPKEKMFLVGTVSDAAKKLPGWLAAVDASGSIPDFKLASASTFLDWLGPLAASSFEQQDAEEIDQLSGMRRLEWRSGFVAAAVFSSEAAAALQPNEGLEERELRLQGILSLAQLELQPEEQDSELRERLDFHYSHQAATLLPAKTSVTEIKRLHGEALADREAAPLFDTGAAVMKDVNASGSYSSSEPLEHPKQSGVAREHGEANNSNDSQPAPIGSFRLRRPRFMEQISLTAAEKGSVNHLVMQHIPLNGTVDEDVVIKTVHGMVERKLLTPRQAEVIDAMNIAAFFASPLGLRLLAAGEVKREVPFSCMLSASRVHPFVADDAKDEQILIQGVVDCVFEDQHGLVLVDYKTDRIINQQWEQAAERHRFQLELYAEAIEAVLLRKVAQCHVFFFDGGQSVRLR
ncbi:helicase-exonuclease AddAB subunit AddA [Paenibacillus sp. FSL H8-0537]|uniref:helicase-exonuclease AddAB subunit AddA n=1 Tax=Paenibacillus sp. FSL H8-0537 TaxID=2921399 RepID=UPI003100B108